MQNVSMSNNQQIWQYLIEFYEDWSIDGHDLLPMMNLVKWLSTSKYKNEIYPNKSLTTLTISAVEDFQTQLTLPSIGVHYGNEVFTITYSPTGQTHNLEKFKCHQTQIISLLESLFIRLADETKIKQ